MAFADTVTSLLEQYYGAWRQVDAGELDLGANHRSGELAAAFATLYLTPAAPPELVKHVYKFLARVNHPDHGGELRTMQKINSAYALLTKGDAK